jgi:flagellar protein FlaG
MKVQGVDGIIPLRQESKPSVLPERRSANVPEAGAQSLEKEAGGKTKDALDQRKLEKAVDQINKTMDDYGTELRFSIHKDSGEMMVKVVSVKDNSVIREIPPERLLDFVAHVKEMLGIIIDKFI